MYEPSPVLMSFFIAGFQHWGGPQVLGELAPGKVLDLVPEFDNPHDPNAITIRYGGVKLGYVPADMNEMLATLMFYGHGGAFRCIVQQVAPERSPWHQVRVGIYVEDAR